MTEKRKYVVFLVLDYAAGGVFAFILSGTMHYFEVSWWVTTLFMVNVLGGWFRHCGATSYRLFGRP